MKEYFDKYINDKYIVTNDENVISYFNNLAININSSICIFNDEEGNTFVYNINWFSERMTFKDQNIDICYQGIYSINKIEKYVKDYVLREEKVKNRESVLKDLGI